MQWYGLSNNPRSFNLASLVYSKKSLLFHSSMYPTLMYVKFLRHLKARSPDTVQLDEEGLKEKKKQKLLKAGLEARARARREKEREKEEKEREERREEEEREMDLAGWSKRLRQEQEVSWHVETCTSFRLNTAIQALMAKIKDRARRKAALTDRKSAAAQARMKNIASLAADDRVSKAKKRKGDRGTFTEAKLS